MRLHDHILCSMVQDGPVFLFSTNHFIFCNAKMWFTCCVVLLIACCLSPAMCLRTPLVPQQRVVKELSRHKNILLLANVDQGDEPLIKSNIDTAIKSIAAVAVISAPLGTFLDNQHGLFGVLNYAQFNMDLTIGDWHMLKSAYWVPFLFSFAGLAMSTIILFLDQVLKTKTESRNPDWPSVLYCISLFSAQYYLSGALDFLGYDPLLINIILSVMAFVGLRIFDRSLAGALLAVATAVAGPAVEIAIINLTHLYSYSHADVLGICSWIPSVYFLGGPAVGNLARRVYAELQGVSK